MVSRSFRGEGQAEGGRCPKFGALFLYMARALTARSGLAYPAGGPKTYGIGISRQFTAEALLNLLLVSVHAQNAGEGFKGTGA